MGYGLLALAVLTVVWGWYGAGALRRLWLAALVFVGVILLHAGVTVLVRMGPLWLSRRPAVATTSATPDRCPECGRVPGGS